MLETEYAAIRWWESRRPIGWTEDQHLVNPTINTSSEVEKALCVSASKAVQRNRRERRKRKGVADQLTKKDWNEIRDYHFKNVREGLRDMSADDVADQIAHLITTRQLLAERVSRWADYIGRIFHFPKGVQPTHYEAERVLVAASVVEKYNDAAKANLPYWEVPSEASSAYEEGISG